MKIALQLPWTGGVPTPINNTPVDNSNFVNPATNQIELGYIITQAGEVAIYVGGFLMFFWAAWGVFDYIRGEGNKEALAKARKKIQWAIVGFIILILSFFLSDLVRTILIGNIGLSKDLPPLKY